MNHKEFTPKELLNLLRFKYGLNGGGYNSEYNLCLQAAADLIEKLTKEEE